MRFTGFNFTAEECKITAWSAANNVNKETKRRREKEKVPVKREPNKAQMNPPMTKLTSVQEARATPPTTGMRAM